MTYTWFKTKYEGIRFREHPSRKYGTRKDRYYAVRYRVDGQRKEEAIGWESQNDQLDKDGARVPMLEVARATLARLKESHRTGEGAPTLAVQRELAAQARVVEEVRVQEEAKANRILRDVFSGYIEWAKTNKKDWDHDETRMTLHVLPLFGDKRLSEISVSDIETLKVKCQEKGHSPATVKHVLQCVRAVYNYQPVDLFMINTARR